MLFLDHVKSISTFVNRKGKIPIMWDDMLRNMPQSEIKVQIVEKCLCSEIMKTLYYRSLVLVILLRSWFGLM